MNLFELFVKIGVDDQASGKLKDLGGKLGNGLKTAAKIGTAAVAAAASGIAALTAAAVNNYAEYEQLVGGVDTLFKNSSQKVQEYAANAYKTAGMSANEYMSTVTSFSASLLKSLGGDTDKAAEYANQALTDMSDNANKMGTSMELIQNAYQGFAKQNYTMLDNLKLGYGGTKTEMERLIADAAKLDSSIQANDLSFGNIVKAINAVQTEMGITGTTAKEAGATISGSIGAMKSAWSNLVTGLANGNADIEKLVDNLVTTIVGDGTESNLGVLGNIIPAVETALNGAVKLVSSLVPKVVSELPKIMKSILPGLVDGAAGLIASLAGALPDLIGVIVDELPNIIETLITALVSSLPQIIAGIGKLVVKLVAALPQILVSLVKGIVSIFTGIWDGIKNVFSNLGGWFKKKFTEGKENAQKAWANAKEVFSKVWDKTKEAFSKVGSWIGEQFKKGRENSQKAWENAKEIFSNVWNKTKEAFANVGSWIGEQFRKGKENSQKAWANAKEIFSNIWEKIRGVFDNAKEKFGNIGKSIVDGLKNGIANAWTGLKDWFSGLWNDLVGGVRKFLGIASPSKVFKKIGEFTAEGFGVGFEDEFGRVKNDVEGALSFDGSYGSISGSIKKSSFGASLGGNTFGDVIINVNGANYSDEQSLAVAIAEQLQNMTDRKVAVYA